MTEGESLLQAAQNISQMAEGPRKEGVTQVLKDMLFERLVEEKITAEERERILKVLGS
jgi:hypothetical protein